MSESLSSEERLKAARKRFEELKKKNKIPLGKLGASKIAVEEHEASNKSEAKPEIHTETSKEQIRELQETIELQKNQIKKLRDENTDLKLERMDLKDKVTDLEKELAHFRANGQTSKAKIPYSVQENATAATESHNVENPISGDLASERRGNSGDYKERVLAWKGWQVDMREWNGCQGAQVAL